MSQEFPDRLLFDGQPHAIDCHPLAPWLASLPERPRGRPTPFRPCGYMATWAVIDDMLCLAQISEEAIARLFAHRDGPVQATWFSGYIRGRRGDRRRTSYPPRTFHEDELVLEIVAGVVTRWWALDLRGVPEQTEQELRLSLPQFLWPARLRGGPIA